MLSLILACVTEEAFPERLAEEQCAWLDRCGAEWPEGSDCEAWIAENEATEYMACDAWDGQQAAACLVALREDEVCDGDVPAECAAMRC